MEERLQVLLKDFRGDNGWSSEVWNRMVKEFHTRNPYACYTKVEIEEKERELKRDYKMLKEAQSQSGCSWSQKRFMIEADAHLWENLKISFPKIKKFQNPKATFPLFDSLGELYDGHLAEGRYNFTSLEDDEPLRRITDLEDDIEDDSLVQEIVPEHPTVHQIEEEDYTTEGLVPASEALTPAIEAPTLARNVQPRKDVAAKKNKEEKEPKKQNKSANIEGMMKQYLEMRSKQAEDEAAQLAKEKEIAHAADFSIKKCISILNNGSDKRGEGQGFCCLQDCRKQRDFYFLF